MKRVKLCLVLVSLLLLLVGCNTVSPVNMVKDSVLEYLEKYNDDFTIKSMVSKTWADEADNIYVESEKYGEIFIVRKYKSGYTDNYFTLTMIDDAKRYVQDLIGDDFEISVKFTEGERPLGLEEGFNFKDYKEAGGSPFCYITLKTQKLLEEDEIDFLVSLFANNRFMCMVEVYVGEESHKYGIDVDFNVKKY